MTESGDPDRAKQLAQVAGLATAVADRIMTAQIMGLQIPEQQVTALVRAAYLLWEAGEGLSPLVEQVLHEFAGDRLTSTADTDGAEPAAT